MTILYGIACVVAIIFMIVFMFLGIWLFIVALKAYKQLRYKNYILEKINQKLDVSRKPFSNVENPTSEEANILNDFDEHLNCNNIRDFDKLNKN